MCIICDKFDFMGIECLAGLYLVIPNSWNMKLWIMWKVQKCLCFCLQKWKFACNFCYDMRKYTGGHREYDRLEGKINARRHGYPRFIPFHPKEYPREKARYSKALAQFSTVSTALLLLLNIYILLPLPDKVQLRFFIRK